jgi:hypothetical protein
VVVAVDTDPPLELEDPVEQMAGEHT